MSQKRVVSLLASGTEIVAALGCGGSLVGRSHECDFPPDLVAALPVCTEPKILVEGESREIDRQVREIVEQALSVYRVDGALLQALAPDIIVTQTQCEVCAVTPRDVAEAVCDWIAGAPEIVALEPHALADVWRDVERVGAALGVPERAGALVASFEARLAAIRDRLPAAESRPRIACIEWIEPLMATGNWMPELIEIAGGDNLFGEAGRHSPWLELEELARADPEVILVLPCGFDIPRTRHELPALSERPEWRRLTAVRRGRVYLCDGNRYFNRSGPRLVESAEILAEILHPGRFDFGHRGDGWIPLGRP